MTYRRALAGQGQAADQTDRRGQGAGDLHGRLPADDENGTFIINGAERVVVSQLVRSPGVYFTVEEDPRSGRGLCMAKLIPNRGAWLEFETSNRDMMSVKVDRKRKIPVTTLLARHRHRHRDESCLSCSPTSTPIRTITYHQDTLDKDVRATPKRRCSSSTAACARATRRRRTTPGTC